eukprot:11966824-Alexandrium_andersonii.AAC.1
MSASLVGSEMCIRDSSMVSTGLCPTYCSLHGARLCCRICLLSDEGGMSSCLLYTSDAADDM